MNRQDQNIPIDDELKALERALADELRVDTPAGLADRVFDATLAPMRDELAELQNVEDKLRDELAVPTPRGLAERVFDASVAHLPGRAEPEPVIARIGWAHSKLWRVAAVVGLVFLYGVLWMNPYQPVEIADDIPLVADALTEDQLEAELDQIARLAGSATYEPVDRDDLAQLDELDRLLDQYLANEPETTSG